jgi:hypothetical protein
MFTALPAIAVIAAVGALLAVQHRDSAVADRRQETIQLAIAAGENARRFIDDQHAILSAVAAAPVVRRGDYRQMRAYLSDVAETGRFTNGLGYVGMDGRLRVSTNQPLGAPRLDLNDREYVQEAIDGRAAVSDVLSSKLAGRPIVVFAYPTSTLRGERSGLVSGSLALDQFDSGLRRLLYAPGGDETIIDGANSVIIGETPVSDVTPVDEDYPIERMRGVENGTLDDVETAQGRRLVGFAHVFGTDWLVLVDRDYGEVLGSFDTALWVEIGALGMLAILGVFATFAFARRLDRLDEMRDAALAEQRTIALELQSSMLPDLPEIDGIAIDAGYVPAQGGMSVGGDWYDVVDMGDGRVAVSVGDVAGHGLQSAAIMGQLRSAVRSLALARVGPADALGQLGRFIATLTGRPLATVIYGNVELATGRLTYAAAGHPPPVIVHEDGSTTFLEAGRSPLLGVDDDRVRPEGEYTLTPGDTLIIYTDGLVERPDIPIDDGLANLAEQVSAGARTAELLASVEEPRRDDVAVLCLRLQPSRVAS